MGSKAKAALLASHNIPQGSKHPNNMVLGPKYYNMKCIWTLKPYYLGPWTLRDLEDHPENVGLDPVLWGCKHGNET